jgi:hypothetical protein
MRHTPVRYISVRRHAGEMHPMSYTWVIYVHRSVAFLWGIPYIADILCSSI